MIYPEQSTMIYHESIRIDFMSIGSRVEQARKHAGLSKAGLANACGISKQGIGQIENGATKEPKPSNLLKIAKVCGVSSDWLIDGLGQMVAAGTVEMTLAEPLANYSINELGNDKIILSSPVPLISWVQAGQFCESHDLLAAGDAEEWLPRPKGASDSTYALTVRGDSMTSPYPGSRSYPDGMIIFVDPEKDCLPGNRGIFKLPDSNEVTFKELVSDAGKLYLKPLNPQYDKIPVDKEMTICGKVIGSYLPE